MALKATIYKADVQIADMDRHYYQSHALTLAKHPSETDERLMVRLLAFVLFADDALLFGKDISADDEPALWLSDLTGVVKLWIEIGQPNERIIRKACGRAEKVVLILYGKQSDLWWKHHMFTHKPNVTVIQLSTENTTSLASMAKRNMSLTCTIEDGQLMVMDDETTLTITPIFLYPGIADL